MQPATVRGTVERRLCFEPPGSRTIGTIGAAAPRYAPPLSGPVQTLTGQKISARACFFLVDTSG